MYVCVHEQVHIICTECPCRPEEGIGSPGNGAIVVYKLQEHVENEPGFSTRAASVLKCWVTSSTWILKHLKNQNNIAKQIEITSLK